MNARTRMISLLAAAAAIVVIVVAIVYATGGYSGYTVRVLLADAGGLQGGSEVNVNGVTVGQVASLTVNKHDRAVAVLHINKSAAPIGQGARATVQIDGFFGERILELSRGDYVQHPEPSGATVPVADSGVSVRLANVVDALNMSAQGALQTFLDEQGAALVGRGHSLAGVLAQLPQTLPALTQLLSQLSANQRALGDLVDRSDRVVAQVAAQRAHLGQMVNSANGALSLLASRRERLGATVQTAPGALRQAQTTLAELQGAAIPLAPAADGLRATAPRLTRALDVIPRFANAAVPTLNEVATVSPALQQLADESTPVVGALAPLTAELTRYSSGALAPLSEMLADKGGAADLFGTMEGWARSTQGYDASSHIFRFGATVGVQSFDELLQMLTDNGLTKALTGAQAGSHRQTRSAPAAVHIAPASVPAAAQSSPASPLAGIGAAVGSTLSGTLGRVDQTAAGLVNTLTGGHASSGSPAAHAGTSVIGATGGGGAPGQRVAGLLHYILGR